MKFTYWFNLAKTHSIVFEMKQENFVLLSTEQVALSVRGSVEERVNGQVLAREEAVKTFIFTPSEVDMEQQELQFSRMRISDQNKWVLEIQNKQNESERMTVGILSDVNVNPLYVDFEHEDVYKAYAQANTMNRIEQTYLPPEIEQTIFSHTFDETGLPEGMFSKTIKFNAEQLVADLKDVKIDLRRPTPAGSRFEVSMKIAPETLDAKAGSTMLFTVRMDGLGTFTVSETGLQFTGALIGSETFTKTWTNKPELEELFSYFLDVKSNLSVKGDGIGQLTLSWGGETLKCPYNPTSRITGIILESGEKEVL